MEIIFKRILGVTFALFFAIKLFTLRTGYQKYSQQNPII